MSQIVNPPRRRFRLRPLDHAIIAGLAIGVVLLLLWPTMFVTIGSGRVGVLFRLFGGGTETRSVFHEGVAMKWPWDGVEIYDTRTQAQNLEVKALGVNGLVITVDVTVLFRPIADEAGMLHQEIGPDYINRVVVPNSVEAVRKIVGQYDPHSIYTSDTFKLAHEIISELKLSTRGLHIDFVDLIVREIMLPDTVNNAINEKLTQEQVAQAYEYRILQAKRDAERKRIEAIGIQTFYSIVADALTPQLLTWRGIEATVEIAKSPNTKVVIVGGGENQLPLILGSDITQQPAMPAPAATDPQGNPLPDFDKLPLLFPEAAFEPHVDKPVGSGSTQSQGGTAAP